MTLLPLLLLAVAQTPKMGTLKGQVEIGPLAPVERVGVKHQVPPEMYKRYAVHVFQAADEVADSTKRAMHHHLVRLDKNIDLSKTGKFQIKLPEGRYMVELSAQTKQTFPRMAPGQYVTITGGKTSTIVLHVDTGIR
jgi:hypothetical protein